MRAFVVVLVLVDVLIVATGPVNFWKNSGHPRNILAGSLIGALIGGAITRSPGTAELLIILGNLAAVLFTIG